MGIATRQDSRLQHFLTILSRFFDRTAAKFTRLQAIVRTVAFRVARDGRPYSNQKFTFVAWSPLADPRVVLGRSPLADPLFLRGSPLDDSFVAP